MRQESGQNQQQPGTPGSGTPLSVSSTNSIDCPPSVGPVSVLMGDSNSSMPSQNMDDIHHMHHQQGQTINFGDMY